MSKIHNAKKSPTVQIDQTVQAQPAEPKKEEDAKPVIGQAYLLLKAAVAPKVGKQAQGGLSYHILGDVDRSSLYVAITANEGGGYFSREIVPFIKVVACLNPSAPGNPFPSKQLRDAFVGRSSNNAGFLAAILRNEKLLARAPDTETQHIVADDWMAWRTTMLAQTGRMIEIALPASDASPAADNAQDDHPDASKAPKTLTIKRPKTEPTEMGDADDDAEPGHAHPA